MEFELDLTVVVPVYRSELSIGQLHERLEATLTVIGRTCEVIYVEDASADETIQELRRVTSASRIPVKVVELVRNVGQLNATAIGMAHARGAVVVTIDDDLQQWPEDIPILLERLDDASLDFVVGVFDSPRQGRLRRTASSHAQRFAVHELGVPTTTRFSSFVALRGQIFRNRFGDQPDFSLATPGWMYRTSNRHDVVTVRHSQRASGRSNYGPRTLFQAFAPLASRMIDNSLRMSRYVGLFIIVACIVGIVATVLWYFTTGNPFPGYASFILLNLTILGVIATATTTIIGQLRRLGDQEGRVPSLPERRVERFGPDNIDPSS
jgi:glycosyltransferase involved in cell wall biosynthesis